MRTIGKQVMAGAVLTAVIMINGCVTPERVAEDIQANRQRRYEGIVHRPADKTESAWEVVSGDLSLADCVELALKYNKDVQNAKLRLLEAKGQKIEALSTALPQATFSGEGMRNDNSGFDNQKETYQLMVLAKQPLYLGGLAGAAIDAAATFTYQTQQELRQAIQQVQLQVRKSYIDSLLADELVKVTEEARLNAKKLLEDTNKKFKFGTATRFEVLRAEVSLNAIQAELIKKKNDAQIAKTNLYNVLGISQASNIELAEKLTYKPIQIRSAACLEIAMKERPDLLIGEAMIRLAEDNIKSEQSNNRPRVYLQGSYMRNYPGFAANFDSFGDFGGGSFGGKEWDRTMRGGLVVEWPFFDGFKTDGRVIQAKALKQTQEVTLRKLEETTQLNVTQSLLNLQDSNQFVLSQMGNVKNAEESVRLAQVGFQEGTVMSLDVIQAQLALAQAQADYSQAVHAYQMSIYNLHASLGTLGEQALPLLGNEAAKPTADNEAGQAEEEKVKKQDNRTKDEALINPETEKDSNE